MVYLEKVEFITNRFRAFQTENPTVRLIIVTPKLIVIA